MEKFKAGMFVYALAFLLGIILVQQLSVLPQTLELVQFFFVFLTLNFSVIYLLYKHKYLFDRVYLRLSILIIMLIIIGMLYSLFYSKYRLNYQLDELYAGQDIVITGWVSSIPVDTGSAQRFEFDVVDYYLVEKNTVAERPLVKFPKKLRLSWYYGELNAGENWQLQVRLKPPHGFNNPGGFDYEGWLFQHGIQATGYVRKSALNERNKTAQWWSINRIRQSLAEQIDRLSDHQDTSESSISLVKALAIGDKSSISAQQWRVLANTGTSHLMAISGLHIGLAALFSYVLLRWILPASVMKRIPAQHVALMASMFSASMYAIAAGLSIPTQRAIIMLFVLAAMMLIRRNHRPVDSLGFALFVVLLVDPLAVLSAGFWFSFSAVAVIFISVSSDKRATDEGRSVITRTGGVFRAWLRLQLMISVFLLPLSLFMFQQSSLVSPLVNLLLIPYVSFLVVPVVLAAIVCSFVLHGLSDLLFELAAMLLDLVWPVLSYLSVQPYAIWVQGDVRLFEVILASAAMLLILYSGRCLHFIVNRIFNHNGHVPYKIAMLWLFRLTAGLLMIPLSIVDKQALNPAEYQLTILDVGQGSAAVIQTQSHVAVFDTGAKFSDRMDAGSSVVVPYLRSQGITDLDRLIISHGDADHIGGAEAILERYPETQVIGQDLENLESDNKQSCNETVNWHWDGVDFRFLSPASKTDSKSGSNKRNNRSCVLRVSSPSGSALFTGDIEKEVEHKLIEKYADRLDTDVLIVPHHGSNTSSNASFIEMVSPEISVISVGYRNRYKLPSKTVVARYEHLGRKLIQTDKNGAVTIKMDMNHGLSIGSNRQISQKYWHHRLK